MTLKPAMAAEAAQIIGTDTASVMAVAQVEGAGRYFNPDGTVLDRFEPHAFPQRHWATMGFAPKPGEAPWRASLRLSKRQRRDMQARARAIDAEAAAQATSFGAFQIMGFNCRKAGFPTALAMKRAFADPAGQITAFARFVVAQGLAGAIRSHDWMAFATVYNGPGQAARYSAEIAAAYRRAAGQPSVEVLRPGARGESVVALQERLAAAGYKVQADGHYGDETRRAVTEFQKASGLKADGIVGAKTWEALPDSRTRPVPQPEKDPQVAGEGKGAAGGAAVATGAGGLLASLLGAVEGHAQTILAVAIAILLLGGVYLFRRQIAALVNRAVKA